MVKSSHGTLDGVFSALSDATRRQVLAALAGGSRPVGELAAAHDMSLPGFLKHLAVLEAAGLIARAKEGRVVNCSLQPAAMQDAARWLAEYEHFWSGRLDALGRFLYQQEDLQAWNPPASTNAPRSPSSASSRSRRRKSGGPGPTRRR